MTQIQIQYLKTLSKRQVNSQGQVKMETYTDQIEYIYHENSCTLHIMQFNSSQILYPSASSTTGTYCTLFHRYYIGYNQIINIYK